jgi:hypothetical protein
LTRLFQYLYKIWHYGDLPQGRKILRQHLSPQVLKLLQQSNFKFLIKINSKWLNKKFQLIDLQQKCSIISIKITNDYNKTIFAATRKCLSNFFVHSFATKITSYYNKNNNHLHQINMCLQHFQKHINIIDFFWERTQTCGKHR